MKSNLTLLLLTLANFSILTSFAQQPFETYNYDVKILTLSDGVYVEHFSNDTLIQIGSVIFNKQTRKVVSFVTYDTLGYSEASLEPEIVSRFISPDPNAHKYADWTPYNYAFSNPIFFNDPDGKDGRAHFKKGDGTKDNPNVITITANYYYNRNSLSKSEAKALERAVSNYNKLTTKSGKAKDGTLTVVNFEFTATAVDSDQAAKDAAGQDEFVDADGEKRGFGNIVTGHETEGKEFGDADGFEIRLNRKRIRNTVAQGFTEDDILESTFNHEIGHNLGGEHGDPSPMQEALRLYYTRPSNQVGGTGTPTVPNATVSRKFVNTIVGRIGTVNPGGQVIFERGKGRQ